MPGCVEEKSKRSPILVEMTVEVMSEEIVELVSTQNVGAGIHHCTSCEVLVDCGVLPPIKLIHHHLPDCMGTGGTVLKVTVTPMWHSEVHCVGPKRRVPQRSSDGRIIEEGLLLHHRELTVATNPQVRSTESNDRVVCDVGELVNDQPCARHLSCPVVGGCICPVTFVILVSDGVGSDLVTHPVHVLNCRVVCVLVGDEEGGLNVTSIGVPPSSEDLIIEVDVVVVDGVVKSDCNHLRDPLAVIVIRAEVAWHLRAILGAEAVRQLADLLVTRRRAVRIAVNIAGIFV